MVFSRGEEGTRDLVLLGRVNKLENGVSKAGRNWARLTMTVVEYDADMDLDVDNQYEIMFIDNESELYGPQKNAEQVQKMKPKEGSVVVVRCSGSEKDDKVSYFGSRMYYPGNVFNLKQSKKGLGCTIVTGVMCPNEEKNTVSIPIRVWNKETATNDTVWYTLTDENGEIELFVNKFQFIDYLTIL